MSEYEVDLPVVDHFAGNVCKRAHRIAATGADAPGTGLCRIIAVAVRRTYSVFFSSSAAAFASASFAVACHFQIARLNGPVFK